MNSLRLFCCLLVTISSSASVQSIPLSVVAYPSLAQRDAEEGVTALMRAARDGERKDVKALLEQGVDVNVRDPSRWGAGGWSALTYAAATGDLEIVKALVSKRAEINASDEAGSTPLMSAVQYHNVSVVKLLIEKGADVNHRDKSGASALTKALRGNQDKIAGILKKAGAVEAPMQIPASPVTSSRETPSTVPASDSVNSKPVLLNSPQPRYTIKAREKRIQGVVRGRALIGADGTVKGFRILTGLPFGLSYEAMDAAYKLTFEPARKDGQPVAYIMSIEIEFKLR